MQNETKFDLSRQEAEKWLIQLSNQKQMNFKDLSFVL